MNSIHDQYLINEESPKINQPSQINIQLKQHQLASIYKAQQIESFQVLPFGIMSDKPGAGKTYTILGHIYESKIKNNLIIVPQNIVQQWTESIYSFSNGLLKFKKLLDYSDIMNFYHNNNEEFNDYDIYLTTSLFYHSLTHALNSNFLKMNRIFFDEIDSISNVIINELNTDFTWFVSASFNPNKIGTYYLDPTIIDTITIKCDESFIEKSFNLENYNEYKIICKNFYLDHIFKNIIDDDEITLLNALDYSKLKKKFHNKIANNENEAISYLISDKKEIIEIEKIRIEDIQKSLEKTIHEHKKNELSKQLETSQNNLKKTQEKLDLILKRLQDNNCCPLCYNEIKNKKKVISPCCQNNICYECADNWFNNMNKTNCVYCNTQNIKFDHYILVKNENENDDDIVFGKCTICDSKFESEDDNLYSNCCENSGCKKCIQEWYFKLLKKECLFCHNHEILHDDFKNKKNHEKMMDNIKNGIRYINKSKLEFIEHFLMTKVHVHSKIIFCSQFPKIFNDLKKMLEKYNIGFIELDDGNIDDINKNIFEYHYGNISVLLMNSNHFGCGLNLQISSDVLFLHKTGHELQTQIIGRAQRPGRKNKLNVWFVMHENEHYYQEKIQNNNEINKLIKNKTVDYSKMKINIIQNENDSKITYL